MSDTVLFDWMEREGFGCWHDAKTKKWVSMAGANFDTPRAAIRAAMSYRGADARDVRTVTDARNLAAGLVHDLTQDAASGDFGKALDERVTLAIQVVEALR